jgi:hypothetical protein
MNPVRACDYRGILARMAWVFQGLLNPRITPNTSKRKTFRLDICLALNAPDQKRELILSG